MEGVEIMAKTIRWMEEASQAVKFANDKMNQALKLEILYCAIYARILSTI